jgi:hypothetical protein
MIITTSNSNSEYPFSELIVGLLACRVYTLILLDYRQIPEDFDWPAERPAGTRKPVSARPATGYTVRIRII